MEKQHVPNHQSVSICNIQQIHVVGLLWLIFGSPLPRWHRIIFYTQLTGGEGQPKATQGDPCVAWMIPWTKLMKWLQFEIGHYAYEKYQSIPVMIPSRHQPLGPHLYDLTIRAVMTLSVSRSTTGINSRKNLLQYKFVFITPPSTIVRSC